MRLCSDFTSCRMTWRDPAGAERAAEGVADGELRIGEALVEAGAWSMSTSSCRRAS